METSQNYEVSFCHQRKQMIAWDQRRNENFSRREDRRNFGSLIDTIIAIFLREGFRWIITQYNSNKRLIGWKDLLNEEKMMDLIISLLTTCESCNMKEIIKNDITPPQKIRERIALRNARWRMLELLKTNMCWAPCLF